MATKIVTKNSSTAASIPSASVLVQGELAVNVTDKRLFTENNTGVVVELGTNPSSITTGSITVTGTVDSRDVAADGTKLDGVESGADVTDTTNVVSSLTAGSNITIAADGTISSGTGPNTTYTAGSGLSLTGTVFANTSPDQTVGLTGSGATSISGTYPNFTISSTNTTYSVGDGGLTQINFTSADNTKLDGIESGATADQTAAQLLTAIKTVDGSGSGLDADKVDGYNISTASTGTDANTIYFRT
tara:strand:+ start:760 stop:1497 length:738 start_codon:yes stop_codon:yes gene_type:complete